MFRMAWGIGRVPRTGTVLVALVASTALAGCAGSASAASSLPTGSWSNWGQCGSHDLISLQVSRDGTVEVNAYVASGRGRIVARGHDQYNLTFGRGVIVQNHVGSTWTAELRGSGRVLHLGDADHGGACPATEDDEGGNCCELVRHGSSS